MELHFWIALGVLFPFFGTALGAAAVFFHRGTSGARSQKICFGFAAGVMLAACVWSLLIPAIEAAGHPLWAVAGLLAGMASFLAGERRLSNKKPRSQAAMIFFSVTLHNLPEGMAVGVALAIALSGEAGALTTAMALSLGIALQNLPEGAVISLPSRAEGRSRTRAFSLGVLSGVVEPVGALSALLLTRAIRPLLPFLLSYAAGAMMFVTNEELIPSLRGDDDHVGEMAFVIGFSAMMTLDVLLG